MKKIKLTQGKFALVDDEDFEYLNQWKWYFSDTGYAIRKEYIGGGRKNQKQKIIRMHRIINKTPDSFYTDHINSDKLDNRKENLRNSSMLQNNLNTTKRKNCTSKYKGVHWDRLNNKWRVCIDINKRTIHAGRFLSEIEAAKAYNGLAIKYHGKFAKLNGV